jgi:hypothetical protein
LRQMEADGQIAVERQGKSKSMRLS